MLIWREWKIESCIGEWVGPYRVIKLGADGKPIYAYIYDPDKQFRIFQAKKYHRPDITPHVLLEFIYSGFAQFHSTEENDGLSLTEILDTNDERSDCQEMDEDKKK